LCYFWIDFIVFGWESKVVSITCSFCCHCVNSWENLRSTSVFDRVISLSSFDSVIEWNVTLSQMFREVVDAGRHSTLFGSTDWSKWSFYSLYEVNDLSIHFTK
jgi:hypothetical protein